MKKLSILMVVLMLSMVACSQNSKKDAATAKAADAPQQAQTQTEAAQAVSMVDPAIADAKINELFKGVKIEVTDIKTSKKSTVDAMFNTAVAVPNTKLTVTVTKFYPDFVMDNSIGTRTLEPNNIAAKVTIAGDGDGFDGWLFASFPDVHAYENPNYSIKVLDAIKK